MAVRLVDGEDHHPLSRARGVGVSDECDSAAAGWTGSSRGHATVEKPAPAFASID